ncbi:unnamed protein product [Polarella glacialis]|uniref:Uncharacterized protein n=1 Tax=Polarella glacialis TaxID=89957 RepID=A0A813GKE5_POLGL|nr:unnamed protein product [Polarella glacialis]
MDSDAGKKGRRAIVFTHDLQGEPDYFATPGETHMGHLAAGWSKQNSVDVVLIVPRADLAKFPLGSYTRSQLKAMGVRLVEVDWVRPPLGPGIPKWAQDSWCVNRDLFKLHVLGLDYDAVVFYDNDVLVAPMDGDALFALFKCARQGYFLATALHGGFEPLAAGFFAVQPSPALLRAVLRFLLGAEYDEDFGWNMMGFGPWGCLDGTDSWCFKSAHVGAECGQGLMYNLFSSSWQIGRLPKPCSRKQARQGPWGSCWMVAFGCMKTHCA